MNPDTYINNNLGKFIYDPNIKNGVKITFYEFNEEQATIIDFIRMISTDYNLDTNEVLLKYFPEIESHKRETYTFIRIDKFRGDEWGVFLGEDNKEKHINLSEMYDHFYSIENNVDT
jgi:hypothetical protein